MPQRRWLLCFIYFFPGSQKACNFIWQECWFDWFCIYVFLQCFWSQFWSKTLTKNYIVGLFLAFLIVKNQYNRTNVLSAFYFISKKNSIIRVPLLFKKGLIFVFVGHPSRSKIIFKSKWSSRELFFLTSVSTRALFCRSSIHKHPLVRNHHLPACSNVGCEKCQKYLKVHHHSKSDFCITCYCFSALLLYWCVRYGIPTLSFLEIRLKKSVLENILFTYIQNLYIIFAFLFFFLIIVEKKSMNWHMKK